MRPFEFPEASTQAFCDLERCAYVSAEQQTPQSPLALLSRASLTEFSEMPEEHLSGLFTCAAHEFRRPLRKVLEIVSDSIPEPYAEPVVADRYSRGHVAQIDRLQAMWETSLRVAVPQITPETLFNVLLSAREALLNALSHGLVGAQEAEFRITARRPRSVSAGKGCAEVVVRVEDPGSGYSERLIPHESEFRDGHRGLLLIRNLASSIVTARGGACISMTFGDGEIMHQTDSGLFGPVSPKGDLQNAV